MPKTGLPTKWTAYTPVFSASYGSVTGIEFFYKMSQDGKYVDIRGKYTSGITTGAEGQIGLPSAVTSGDSSIIPSLSNAGEQFLANGAGAFVFTVLIEPSVTYMTVGIQDGTRSGLVKRNANEISANGNVFSLVAKIPLN